MKVSNQQQAVINNYKVRSVKNLHIGENIHLDNLANANAELEGLIPVPGAVEFGSIGECSWRKKMMRSEEQFEQDFIKSLKTMSICLSRTKCYNCY